MDRTQFPKPYPVWLVLSFRLYVNWMGVILLLPVSPKFLCLKAQHFLIFSAAFSISLDLLCLSFSPCLHQLLLAPSTFLICCTCSLFLPSWILALLYTTVTYCGLHKKSEKTVSKFHITKTFFFSLRSTMLSFNIRLYIFLVLGSNSNRVPVIPLP